MFLRDIQPVMMWERSPSTCQTVYESGKIAGSLTGGNWMSDTTYSHRILKTYGLLVDFEEGKGDDGKVDAASAGG
ncbi:hypothetical protein G6F65_021779 [Rhizopus arrhizus]|nr:hypothetical protein G6F65_021779 [Rhizopus arrhizus]